MSDLEGPISPCTPKDDEGVVILPATDARYAGSIFRGETFSPEDMAEAASLLDYIFSGRPPRIFQMHMASVALLVRLARRRSSTISGEFRKLREMHESSEAGA